MPVPLKDNIVADSEAVIRQSKKLVDLMTRTGYTLIQINGQRRFGGPPPNWSGPAPPKDSEIFVGKIPRNCYEDELVPIFEGIGRIYELRLMMDFSGSNRGYAFVMFPDPETADKAVNVLNNFEIRPGRRIGVVKSVNNCRLYIGGLPVHTSQRAIKEEEWTLNQPSDPGKNAKPGTEPGASWKEAGLLPHRRVNGRFPYVIAAKIYMILHGSSTERYKVAGKDSAKWKCSNKFGLCRRLGHNGRLLKACNVMSWNLKIGTVIVRLTGKVANIHVNTSNGKNRRTQYAIVEYESHRDAAMARRRLIPERIKLWGRDIVVDWAAVNTTRNAQRSRNHLQREDLDHFEEPDISCSTSSLNQQLDKNHTNPSTRNAFTKGLWSLERAMDEELYGVKLCDTSSIDLKSTAALEPSVCCPGKMRFLSNLKQVNCIDSLCDTLPSNRFGGLATNIFEGNVNFVNGLRDYNEKKYFLKQHPSVPRLNLSLNETQINEGMENVFAKIHEDQLINISGKTLSDLIADLNINYEDTMNNYQSFCSKIFENKNDIFNPLMNFSENKLFDQKGKANVSVTNAGLGYNKQEHVLGNSCATTQSESLKRFSRAPGTPVMTSNSGTTYIPSGYEDSSLRLLNRYQRMFFA
ncbi:uncharacterized protein [Anabrus simplex]|uniref:uncharacterized protein n=1 Tax=Anabrus simplex TaxID=316456 RepID=UPI0035A2C88A